MLYLYFKMNPSFQVSELAWLSGFLSQQYLKRVERGPFLKANKEILLPAESYINISALNVHFLKVTMVLVACYKNQQ